MQVEREKSSCVPKQAWQAEFTSGLEGMKGNERTQKNSCLGFLVWTRRTGWWWHFLKWERWVEEARKSRVHAGMWSTDTQVKPEGWSYIFGYHYIGQTVLRSHWLYERIKGLNISGQWTMEESQYEATRHWKPAGERASTSKVKSISKTPGQCFLVDRILNCVQCCCKVKEHRIKTWTWQQGGHWWRGQ